MYGALDWRWVKIQESGSRKNLNQSLIYKYFVTNEQWEQEFNYSFIKQRMRIVGLCLILWLNKGASLSLTSVTRGRVFIHSKLFPNTKQWGDFINFHCFPESQVLGNLQNSQTLLFFKNNDTSSLLNNSEDWRSPKWGTV